MLEFILSVVPLILFCTALGLLLINFDEVVGYLLFLLKSLVMPKQAPTQSAQLQVIATAPSQQKVHIPFYQLPFVLIHRLFTLITAVFLPDIHISTGVSRDAVEEPDLVAATAQQEAQKSQLRTYNTPTTSSITSIPDTRDAPVTATHVSSIPLYVPIFDIIHRIFIYLLIIMPFAIIGAGIMMYYSETKATGENLNQWLTGKIEVMIERFSTR